MFERVSIPALTLDNYIPRHNYCCRVIMETHPSLHFTINKFYTKLFGDIRPPRCLQITIQQWRHYRPTYWCVRVSTLCPPTLTTPSHSAHERQVCITINHKDVLVSCRQQNSSSQADTATIFIQHDVYHGWFSVCNRILRCPKSIHSLDF